MTPGRNPRLRNEPNIPLLPGNPAVMRRSGLLLPRNLPFKVWEGIGGELTAALNSSAWWVADWLAYGEDSYADRYTEAIKRTSLNYQTLRNYTWVARSFELSRRRDALSFGHHAEVAALERPEQDYWLSKAEELSWSRNELRKQVRASRRERGLDQQVSYAKLVDGKESAMSAGTDGVLEISDSRDKKVLHLQIDAKHHEVLAEVAATQDCPLEEWATKVLEAAALACVQRISECRMISAKIDLQIAAEPIR